MNSTSELELSRNSTSFDDSDFAFGFCDELEIPIKSMHDSSNAKLLLKLLKLR
jgi:hypothetical protein